MRKLATIVVLILITTGAFAQTTDFFELVKAGTPQDIQSAISPSCPFGAT